MIEVLARLTVLDPQTADEAANKRYVDNAALVGVSPDATMVEAGNTLTVSSPVGGWNLGATIAPTDTVWDILRRLLNPTTPPNYVQPTLSLSPTPPVAQEIGATVSPVLSPTFNPGSSGGITQYTLLKDGTNILTNPTAIPHTDAPPFQLVTNVVYQAQAAFAEGAALPDSEGVTNPTDPNRIMAGSVTSTVTYQALRRVFYGAANAAPTNSAGVRALANQPLNPAPGSVLTMDGIGTNGVVFAVPQPRTLVITMPLAMNMNVTPAPTTASVDGATVGQNAATYNIYFIPQAVAPSTTTPYEARIS